MTDTPLALAAMVVKQTAAQILAIGLEVAEAIGLEVTTWRAGDPTRSYYKYLAVVLESLEQQNVDAINAGFLRSAEDEWLEVYAEDMYGVTPIPAGYATPTVTLTNTGTRRYELDAGDIVARSSTTSKTYHSTDAGTWVGGTTLEIAFIADEAGADSSVGEDEVDELVTTYLGLEITGSTASTAADKQGDDSVRQQCEDSRGAVSPDGPADAYAYVVKNSELTGDTEITRAETDDDSGTLEVTVYVAGNSGTVSSTSIAAAQDAVETWATPLCVTPTVVNATPLTVPINATVSGENLPDDWETTVTEALTSLFADWRIGRRMSLSTINKTICNAVAEIDDVDFVAPTADIEPAISEVLVLGTITLTET
jgi:hypothetical protein